MKKTEFDWLKRRDGTSEFEEFLEMIPEKDVAKLLSVINKTEAKGIRVAIKMEWVKKLDYGIYELRSKMGSNIQRVLYFQEVDSRYRITHGFTKKTNKTPRREIEHALAAKKLFEEGVLK